MASSSTDAIAFLPPDSSLNDYVLMSQPGDQPDTIPAIFKDAMRVRHEVFGKEQGVPMEYEMDEDDARSSHWVIYSTPDVNDLSRIPIGTIRAVPFPHAPHPEDGARYLDLDLGDDLAPPPPPSKEPPPYIVDKGTTFHNGREPYIKLGRMCVLKEYRGKGIATILTTTAMQWLRENPTIFNPSLETADLKDISLEEVAETRIWKGLLLVHAQESVAPAWTKWGFLEDEKMGTWYEAGIPHKAMFQRLAIGV